MRALLSFVLDLSLALNHARPRGKVRQTHRASREIAQKGIIHFQPLLGLFQGSLDFGEISRSCEGSELRGSQEIEQGDDVCRRESAREGFR